MTDYRATAQALQQLTTPASTADPRMAEAINPAPSPTREYWVQWPGDVPFKTNLRHAALQLYNIKRAVLRDHGFTPAAVIVHFFCDGEEYYPHWDDRKIP